MADRNPFFKIPRPELTLGLPAVIASGIYVHNLIESGAITQADLDKGLIGGLIALVGGIIIATRPPRK